MNRDKITFSGHYKATSSSSDDSVLTFTMPLNLDTGYLAQKSIKAKIIHFDCKYPVSKMVQPAYSIGFHFSKEDDAITNWQVKDLIPLDNSLTWDQLVETLNAKYEKVWKTNFKYWPSDTSPAFSIEEEDDQHSRFVLHIPPQVALTFRTEKFIGNFLGFAKYFKPFKRTFGPGTTDTVSVMEYYYKNEIGKTIRIEGDPIPTEIYTPLRYWGVVDKEWKGKEKIAIIGGIITLIQNRFINAIADQPFENTATNVANFLSNTMGEIFRFCNFPTTLIKASSPSPDTVDVRMISTYNLAPLEGLAIKIKFVKTLEKYDAMQDVLQPAKEELNFELGSTFCYLFNINRRFEQDPLANAYPITIMTPASSASSIARSFVHNVGHVCVLAILDKFGHIQSESFPISSGHQMQFQLIILDAHLNKWNLPKDAEAYVKILFEA